VQHFIQAASADPPLTEQAVRQLLPVIIFTLIFRFKGLIRFLFLEILNYRTTSEVGGDGMNVLLYLSVLFLLIPFGGRAAPSPNARKRLENISLKSTANASKHLFDLRPFLLLRLISNFKAERETSPFFYPFTQVRELYVVHIYLYVQNVLIRVFKRMRG